MRRDYLFFESDRLFIRPTTEEDAELILSVFNTSGALTYIGDRNIHNLKDAIAFIQSRTLKQLRERGFANYTLLVKESGTKVGVCGLYARPGLEHVDLGYALLQEHEGRGYATEACETLMSAAKEVFHLPALDAITHPENERSQRLLRKLGFDEMGPIALDGYAGESVLYRKEW